MAINNEPTIKPRTITGIFTGYIAKVLPLAFDDSMSYYECLCALLKYLNETIVTDINNTNDGLAELQQFYVELQDYVNNYLNPTNLKPMVDEKLDQMLEDGDIYMSFKTNYDETTKELEFVVEAEPSNALIERLATLTTPEGSE